MSQLTFFFLAEKAVSTVAQHS